MDTRTPLDAEMLDLKTHVVACAHRNQHLADTLSGIQATLSLHRRALYAVIAVLVLNLVGVTGPELVKLVAKVLA